MLHTSFTKLTGCRVPIQLAGMPVVSVELATAVAGAGGLAMFSGLRASAPYLVSMLDRVAERTGARAGVNFIIRFLDRETVGEISAMALYAGHSVDAVQRVQPAAEIVRELSDGAERILAAWALQRAPGDGPMADGERRDIPQEFGKRRSG